MPDLPAQLQQLREDLTRLGAETWARELLDAETSASTSGEIISNTGVVLRRLLKEKVAKRLGLRKQVRAALAECDRLWKRSSR